MILTGALCPYMFTIVSSVIPLVCFVSSSVGRPPPSYALTDNPMLANAFWAVCGAMNVANPPTEAQYYLSYLDTSTSRFHGSRRYILKTRPPEVLGFWSIALYDAWGRFPKGLSKRQVGSFDSGLQYDKGEKKM